MELDSIFDWDSPKKFKVYTFEGFYNLNFKNQLLSTHHFASGNYK